MSRKENKRKENQKTNNSPLSRPGLIRPELQDVRYANLLRCSNLTQADTSPEGQKQFNDAFGRMNEMACVADIHAEGVSGSQTFNRQDLKKLLEVHAKTPFDAVLVFDLSRLTRGGIRHGNVVEDELRKAGIRLISTTDLIPDGPEGELVKSVKHYSNQLQARSISLAVARGLAQSLARGDRPAAGNPPYGLDRLYISAAGEKRMLIRWDGLTQYWLEPETLRQVNVQVRPDQPRRRKRNDPQSGGRRKAQFKGYIKQADEKSRFVPGAKEKLDVLIWMLSAHFLKGWGYHLITKELNDRGIPSPLGTKWCRKSVRTILYNPIYLGVEVRHRWSGALYNMLGPEGPIPVNVDQDALEAEGRTCVPRHERPRDEWQLVDVPHLKNLLPSPLREIAAERIMAKLDPEAPAHPRKGVPLHTGEAIRHRQHHSPFLVTNILHSKQSGNPMRGEIVNKKLKDGQKTYRYYFDGASATTGVTGLLVRRVEAEPIERVVVDALTEVLAGAEGLGDLVGTEVARQMKTEVQDDGRKADLLAEEEAIKLRMRRTYRLGKAAADALEEELAADAKRLGRLTAELRRLEKQKTAAPVDPEKVAHRVVQRMQHLRDEFGRLPNKEVKEVLAAMVEEMQVDLETMEVSFKLVVPMMLTTTHQDAAQAVRLETELPWWSPVEANRIEGPDVRIVLGTWRCNPTERGSGRSLRLTRCYLCSRVKRAA